ncbi:acylneuraminate cytidylyltransferase family protein [uncultured Desulfobacter sp.]|uniref:acylneuraminate cytidylyltransferase family protein n=1 Tax=uncultured Desulfobacter sp. TaxID=240139 RepID=UPI002AAA8E52|nr:acylneuraminate cytidylyltransferase family protein [uncultured Desulfobacter sp.]
MMKSNLAIIPARGGSKRLKNKNTKLLCDRPLIVYSLEAVIESNQFDSIIVTSDSDEILELCKEYAGDRIRLHKRPDHLATDTSTVLETVKVIADEEKNAGREYDVIGLFLPTAPLRTAKDVNEAMALLDENTDSIVSITNYEFPPQLGLIKDKNELLCAYHESDPFRKEKTRSQDYEMIYRPNGAIYISWWEKFLTNKNFFKGTVGGYFMPREVSVDIDTEFDLVIASNIVKKFDLPLNTP